MRLTRTVTMLISFDSGMNSIIKFVELENRVISATYRNLMIRAKVVLVDKTSGEQLPDPVTTMPRRLPNGSLRIRLPERSSRGPII